MHDWGDYDTSCKRQTNGKTESVSKQNKSIQSVMNKTDMHTVNRNIYAKDQNSQ